jgi:hypothetical protein
VCKNSRFRHKTKLAGILFGLLNFGVKQPPPMHEQTIIYALLALAAIYFIFIRPILLKKKKTETFFPALDTAHQVPNDKLILVSNIAPQQLQEVLQQLCGEYNSNATIIYPQLVITHDERLVVRFPYNVPFELFCNLLNNMVYPGEENLEPIAIGWGTFTGGEDIVPKEMAGQKLMVFVPEEDENHIQFFMVTEQNLGCHLQMVDPKGYKLHPEPEEKYMAPPFDWARVDEWARDQVEVVEQNKIS